MSPSTYTNWVMNGPISVRQFVGKRVVYIFEYELLCDTTPCRASVATNGLWRVAARAWHKPPADACSVVSAHPLHLDR